MRRAVTWTLLWLGLASAVAVGVLVGSLLAHTAIAASRPAVLAAPQRVSPLPSPAAARLDEGPDWYPRLLGTDPDLVPITSSPAVTGRSPEPTGTPRTAQPSAVLMAPAALPVAAGVATWYCEPGRSPCTVGFPAGGYYAAAGPELRAALGDWRGQTVTVEREDGAAAVRVRLVDTCACPGERVLDLYGAAFAVLAPLSRGVIRVEVKP